MKKIVIYYSKTGNSKRVAEKMGNNLGIETVEIIDVNKYKGIFGFIKGGYFASSLRKVDYSFKSEIPINEYNHVYIVGPVWANKLSPAIYSFLMDYELKEKTLVLTNSGGNPEKTFLYAEEKFGKFKNKYCISKSRNEEEIIKKIGK